MEGGEVDSTVTRQCVSPRGIQLPCVNTEPQTGSDTVRETHIGVSCWSAQRKMYSWSGLA